MFPKYQFENSGIQGVAALERYCNTEEEFLLQGHHNFDFFMLSSSTREKYLDVKNARKDGYQVIRSRVIDVGDSSIVAFPAGQIVVFGKLSASRFGPGGLSTSRALDLASEALKDNGLEVLYDPNSSQENDLIYKGQKLSGVSVNQYDSGSYVFGCFISMNVDYTMFDYISLPTEKMEGKPSNTVQDRITGVNEHSNISQTDILNSLAAEFKSEFNISSFNNRHMSNEKKKINKIEKNLKSNNQVYKYTKGNQKGN